MNFEITGGGLGFFGTLIVIAAIAVVVIMAVFVFALAKKARDQVAEDTDHDLEA